MPSLLQRMGMGGKGKSKGEKQKFQFAVVVHTLQLSKPVTGEIAVRWCNGNATAQGSPARCDRRGRVTFSSDAQKQKPLVFTDLLDRNKKGKLATGKMARLLVMIQLSSRKEENVGYIDFDLSKLAGETAKATELKLKLTGCSDKEATIHADMFSRPLELSSVTATQDAAAAAVALGPAPTKFVDLKAAAQEFQAARAAAATASSVSSSPVNSAPSSRSSSISGAGVRQAQRRRGDLDTVSKRRGSASLGDLMAQVTDKDAQRCFTRLKDLLRQSMMDKERLSSRVQEIEAALLSQSQTIHEHQQKLQGNLEAEIALQNDVATAQAGLEVYKKKEKNWHASVSELVAKARHAERESEQKTRRVEEAQDTIASFRERVHELEAESRARREEMERQRQEHGEKVQRMMQDYTEAVTQSQQALAEAAEGARAKEARATELESEHEALKASLERAQAELKEVGVREKQSTADGSRVAEQLEAAQQQLKEVGEAHARALEAKDGELAALNTQLTATLARAAAAEAKGEEAAKESERRQSEAEQARQQGEAREAEQAQALSRRSQELEAARLEAAALRERVAGLEQSVLQQAQGESEGLSSLKKLVAQLEGERDAAAERLKEAQQRQNNVEDQLVALQRQAAAQSDSIARLQQQSEALQGKLDSAGQRAAEQAEEVSGLAREKEAAGARLGEEQRVVTELRGRITQLEEEAAARKSELQAAEQDKAQSEQKLTQAQEDAIRASAESNAAQARLTERVRELEEGKLEQGRSQVDALERQLLALQEDNKNANASATKLQGELHQLELKHQALQIREESLQQEVRDSKGALEAAKQSHAEEKAALEAAAEDLRQQTAHVQNDLSVKSALASERERTLRDQQQQQAGSGAGSAELLELIGKIKGEKADMANKARALNEGLMQRIKESEKEKVQLFRSLREKNEEMESLRESHGELDFALEQANSQLAEEQTARQKLEQEHTAAQLQAAQQGEQVDSLTLSNQSMSRELEVLKRNNELDAAQLGAQGKELEGLRARVKAADAISEFAGSKSDKAAKQLEYFETQLREADNTLEASNKAWNMSGQRLMKEVQRLEGVIDELESKLEEEVQGRGMREQTMLMMDKKLSKALKERDRTSELVHSYELKLNQKKLELASAVSRLSEIQDAAATPGAAAAAAAADAADEESSSGVEAQVNA